MQEGTTNMAHISSISISLVTPIGGYMVQGTVDGQVTSFLVDTGSALTHMRKDAWHEISNIRSRKLKPWAKFKLLSAGGTPLQVYGATTVNLTLEGHSCQADVVVVSPLTTEAIIGIDFLKKNNGVVDLRDGKLRLGDQISLTLCHSLQCVSEVNGTGSVHLVETLKLPPLSEQVVMAKVRDIPKGVSCIIEPNTEKRLPCAVARVLVESKAGMVPVMYPKPDSVSIPAGMVIATIESVEIPITRVVASVPAKPQDLECKIVEFLWGIVNKCATPNSTKEVPQFLGLAGYYRRFIQDFAKIARPLHRLTERNASFKWTDDCQAAFSQLKSLVSGPVLAYPDFSQLFILDTNASDTGIGAVLSQIDQASTRRVITYASTLLSKPERRYCVTRRELLAVVTFTQHFRHFLMGRHFTVRTDHGSLTWLKNFK